jgi:hypothetical protein
VEQPIVTPANAIPVPKGVTLDQLDGWKVAQAIFFLFVAFLAYLGRSALQRIEKLESEAVRKEAFEKAHNENKETLARIEDKIDIAAQATLIEQVREIKATVGKLEVYADGLKHNHIDPYTRALAVLQTRVDEMDKRSHK